MNLSKPTYGIAPVTTVCCAFIITGCNLFAPPVAQVPDTVPDFDQATFSDPRTIDNPYLPYRMGATWTYRGETEDGMEEIVIEVLDDAQEVMGIPVLVVRDTVTLDGVLVEDTRDWFAQDDEGNVWYLGEEVDNYNYDDDGSLINVTHDGAWKAGEDTADVGVNALPGIVMEASPMVGDVYNQEYYPGEAEDMGEVVALNVEIALGDGTEYTTLQTRDFTPLEPGVSEHKYYAQGIGLVREEAVGGGEQIDLVSFEVASE
jgi:hypothetical protein